MHEFCQQVKNLLAVDFVKVACRLVSYYDIRLINHGAHDRSSLEFTSRKFRWHFICKMRNAEGIQFRKNIDIRQFRNISYFNFLAVSNRSREKDVF